MSANSPDHRPARPESGETARPVRGRIFAGCDTYIGDSNDLWYSAEAYRRLQSALTEAQREIDALQAACRKWRVQFDGKDLALQKARAELAASQQCIAELREALIGMVEVFAKPHNETLHEVIAARRALAACEGAVMSANSPDLQETIEAQRREIAELSADARRWRHARKFLSVIDVEMWSGESWGGHVPLERESTKADAAIDAAIARATGVSA